MKTTAIILAAILPFAFAGCQLTDSAPKVSYVGEKRKLPRSFIILGDTEFEGEFTAACADYGINIKPIALRQSVAELESPTRLPIP